MAENGSKKTVFKVYPARPKAVAITLIAGAICAACLYGTRTPLNSVELWLSAAVSALITLGGLVIVVLRRPLLEMNAETLVLRDGALRAPIRVPLRHVLYFELELKGTLRVIIKPESAAAYRSQRALDTAEFGVHYAVPLLWVSGDKILIAEQLNTLLKSSQSR